MAVSRIAVYARSQDQPVFPDHRVVDGLSGQNRGRKPVSAARSNLVAMRMSAGELASFLRAHRARVEPASVGLPAVGDRRVEGLRREEVAVLAVVSADYYTRLEQGRERNPSAQVLNGIAHALRLDADARAHLFRLAGLMPTPRLGAGRDQVHPALLQLLDNFPTAAAGSCLCGNRPTRQRGAEDAELFDVRRPVQARRIRRPPG